MNSSTKPPVSAATEQQERAAMALLNEALRLGQMYEDALLKAEAAFREIGKPLPLFDRLEGGR
jgi:hypothetical protein